MSLNFYTEQEEAGREESVNNYKYLFDKYEDEFPSLYDSLIQMFESANANEQKAKELAQDIINKCKSKIDKKFDDIKKKYFK